MSKIKSRHPYARLREEEPGGKRSHESSYLALTEMNSERLQVGEKCTHPPQFILDLTMDSGDIVCSKCGLVIMERQCEESAQSQSEHTQSNNSQSYSSGNARQKIEDTMAILKIDSRDIVYSTLHQMEKYSDFLRVPMVDFLEKKKYVPYFAFAFFQALIANEIFRDPYEIANIFEVSFKHMLRAENVLNSLVERKWKALSPPLYCRPSQLALSVCAKMELQYPVSYCVMLILREIESSNFGTSNEKLIYATILSVLHYLRPNHCDKVKLEEEEKLKKILTIGTFRDENGFPSVPDLVVIKYLKRNKLV